MRTFFASLILLTHLACGGAAQATDTATEPATDTAVVTAADSARRLFEREWQWQLRQQPEFATSIGDHRFDAALSDTSLGARAAAAEHARQVLFEARQIDRAALTGQDRVSYDLFIAQHERMLAARAFTDFDPQPLSGVDGLHLRLPRLVAAMPFMTEADYRNYLARLAALPAHVDGLIEQMRAGMAAGWTVPKAAMAPVPAALHALHEDIAAGAMFAPFLRLPATIAPQTREDLLVDGISALADAAQSLHRLEQFVRKDYVPAARESIGASSLPGGADWYAFLARHATSTRLTPSQVHAIGLREVARLRAEMAALVPRTGFRGSLEQFLTFARTDPRLFFQDQEALLARYRKTVARASAKLPRVVATVPDAGIAVKPMTTDGSPGAGQPLAYYEAGSEGRSAALVVNVSQPGTRPIWQVDSVALHEALPGHHLQVARALAAALPAFRRHGWYPAFGEGWATYAESLGPQLGFFDDPFSRFGRLNEEMLRAARLVVDTGIHTLGWSRKQAIDYLNTHTANPPPDNEAEVDRIIAQPAQALAYKIGQLRIAALRERAANVLGRRFDLRRFHDAVLGGGALPLDALERQVERWIAAEREAAKPTRPTGPAPAPAAAPATTTSVPLRPLAE